MFDRFGDFDLVLLAFGVLGDQDRRRARPRAAVEIVESNYIGAVSVRVPVVDRLRAQGHGTIVVLSSVAGERARKSNFVYGSSKAGLDAFFQGLGDASSGTGVRVMIVRPGFVHTKMTEGMEPAPLATTPEAVADAIVTGLGRGSRDRLGAGAAALRDVGAAPRAPPGLPQAPDLSADQRARVAERRELLAADLVVTRDRHVGHAAPDHEHAEHDRCGDHPATSRPPASAPRRTNACSPANAGSTSNGRKSAVYRSVM